MAILMDALWRDRSGTHSQTRKMDGYLADPESECQESDSTSRCLQGCA